MIKKLMFEYLLEVLLLTFVILVPYSDWFYYCAWGLVVFALGGMFLIFYYKSITLFPSFQRLLLMTCISVCISFVMLYQAMWIMGIIYGSANISKAFLIWKNFSGTK